jgi:hypothetical protein
MCLIAMSLGKGKISKSCRTVKETLNPTEKNSYLCIYGSEHFIHKSWNPEQELSFQHARCVWKMKLNGKLEDNVQKLLFFYLTYVEYVYFSLFAFTHSPRRICRWGSRSHLPEKKLFKLILITENHGETFHCIYITVYKWKISGRLHHKDLQRYPPK